jgi:membrane associated rhomboid family serine protease
MIPLADSIRSRRTPYVNYALIAANVAIFLYELSLGPRLDEFIHRFGVTPRLITLAFRGDAPEAVWLTLITSQFLHGGWAHLLGNMLFLWIFGDNIEDRFGHLGYLLFYLFCGVGAALAQVVTAPLSPIPLIGASGAIAGVLGGYFILYPGSWVTVLFPLFFFLVPLNVPAVLVLLLWFVGQFFAGLATIHSTTTATGGIAFWAHVGGFLLGAALALVLPKAPAYERPRPVAVAPVRAPARQPATAIAQVVTTLFDLLGLLLLARFFLVLLPLPSRGALDLLVDLVRALSAPFVEPFTHLAPLLRIGQLDLELYTLLALLAYHLLGVAVAWVFTAASRPRSRWEG